VVSLLRNIVMAQTQVAPMQEDHHKVMIVEDDARLADLTQNYLINNGLEVLCESDGAQAIDRIRAEQPDLVVLDLMLPSKDGLAVCREVRPFFKGPILMLTARDDDLDQVLGLEMGADDYVTKPVRPRVLLARIRALLRRSHDQVEEPVGVPGTQGATRLTFGDLAVDNAMREAWLNDVAIDLTSAEFDLLWLLCSNAGRVLSREEIFSALRGIEYDGQDRSIDVRISRIRPKVGDDPVQPRRIKTVRSKGVLVCKRSFVKRGFFDELIGQGAA
jgi:two-component system response regulator RstA